MLTRIHVNQHNIKRNRALLSRGILAPSRREPVLTVKDYKRNRLCNDAVIRDRDGRAVARIIYRPDKPLACGAVCWIETNSEVTVL